MSDWDDYNPVGSAGNALDFLDKLNKATTASEAEKTRKLLEEQVRLQREALELEKKKFAQEQEKIKIEREQQRRGQTRHTPRPYLPTRRDIPSGSVSETSYVGRCPERARSDAESAIRTIAFGGTGLAGFETTSTYKAMNRRPHPDEERKTRFARCLSNFWRRSGHLNTPIQAGRGQSGRLDIGVSSWTWIKCLQGHQVRKHNATWWCSEPELDC